MGETRNLRKQALRRVHQARRSGDVKSLLNIATRDPDQLARSVAIRALGVRREAAAVEPLRRLLHSADFGVRLVTIRALGRIGDPQVGDDLYRLATNDACHRGIRETAVAALLQMGDRRAVPVLAQFVVSDQFSRRESRWAMKKLRAHRGFEAIPLLRTGGSRRFGLIDRMRLNLLIRALETHVTGD